METINLFPFWLSLKTASISTLFVFMFGVFFAYIIGRSTFIGKSIVEALFLLPLVLPPTVVGFGLLYLFGKNGIIGILLIHFFDFHILFCCYGSLYLFIFVSFFFLSV